MKIHGNPNVMKALQLYNKQKTDKTQKSEKVAQKKDQLELSEKAKDFQVAMKAFQKLPDVREDKVTKYKEDIRSGSYEVSGKEILDKMIRQGKIDQKI